MWYVLQVSTGQEISVREALTKHGFAALVPRENRSIRKSGKWQLKEYILFGGYVFVKMEYNAENYYRVTGIPSVQRILNTDGTPVPLTNLEAEWIKALSGQNGEPMDPSCIRVTADGSFEIISGVLRKFAARPLSYDHHSHRAKVEITLCGQPKVIQLSVSVVETEDI